MRRAADTTLREQAFTLIEMIVVLVLLGLAMAAMFPAIGNMLKGSTRSSASAQASGEAGLAARLLESDVRAALGDRGTGERVATSTVTTNQGLQLSTIPALTVRSARASDIYAAGPRHLYLNADVYPTLGVERVEWELRLNDATCGDRGTSNLNWCLQRRVYSSAGGVLSLEVPVRGRGSYPTNITSCAPGLAAIATERVFCFQESMPQSRAGAVGTPAAYTLAQWTSTCQKRWEPNGPNTVSPYLLATPPAIVTQHNLVDLTTAPTSISRLDRITNVGASILSGGGFGKSSERSYEHVEMVIRSRENEAYREAIMCGTRAGWGK